MREKVVPIRRSSTQKGKFLEGGKKAGKLSWPDFWGKAAGGFGSPAQTVFGQQQGTRAVPYSKTQEYDTSSSSTGAKSTVFYNSIVAMPQYSNKSPDELRWEDYQVRPSLHALSGELEVIQGKNLTDRSRRRREMENGGQRGGRRESARVVSFFGSFDNLALKMRVVPKQTLVSALY
jgi:hypothetical protein